VYTSRRVKDGWAVIAPNGATVYIFDDFLPLHLKDFPNWRGRNAEAAANEYAAWRNTWK
jgi:hypothetical protein